MMLTGAWGMKTLGLLSHTGGSGKTTLAVHLAVLAQAVGARVLLIDLDPQGHATAWSHTRATGTPELQYAGPAALVGRLEAARKAGVDLAIIDPRPGVQADSAQVAALSDFVLVPVCPANLDLLAVQATLDGFEGGHRRAAIVLNACQPSQGKAEAIATRSARRALRLLGAPVAPVSIAQRKALAQSLASGMTASEIEPESHAAKEVGALWRYVETELDK